MTPGVENQEPRANILVVDDDTQLRNAMATGFQRAGFQTTTAEDGRTAIEQLKAGEFDGVVLDLHMAPVSGWEVVEFLRESDSEVVTILLSGNVDVPAAVTALKSGVFDVMQKPVRLAELATRLGEALTRREKKNAPEVRVSAKAPREPAPNELLGDSAPMKALRGRIDEMARFRDLSTLIIGETGTGKELVAAAMHEKSSPGAPYVSINCAAIPEQLFEAELFGTEAGAFTGAKGTRAGLLESAGEGTLFLDEVGEMPLLLQPKLLRVLQTRTFRRVGGRQELPFLARVVSATNRPLSPEAQADMRSDLYFRLAGLTLKLPPLRQRKEDLDTLACHFLRQFSERYPGTPNRLESSAVEVLKEEDWPGNVRQLRTVIEQAAVMTRGPTIDARTILSVLSERKSSPRGSAEPPPASAVPGTDLGSLQQKMCIEAYEQQGKNLARAARQLGIPRTTLRDRLKRYGVL